MNLVSNLLERISKLGLILGGFFIILGTLLLVGNVFGRFLSFSIPGSYELFELMMVIPVGFALLYTALKKGHVIVELIISRFPMRVALVLEIINCLASFAAWILVAYASLQMVRETGWLEQSDILDLPVAPFRVLFFICLIFFSITYLADMAESFRRLIKK